MSKTLQGDHVAKSLGSWQSITSNFLPCRGKLMCSSNKLGELWYLGPNHIYNTMQLSAVFSIKGIHSLPSGNTILFIITVISNSKSKRPYSQKGAAKTDMWKTPASIWCHQVLKMKVSRVSNHEDCIKISNELLPFIKS